MKQPGVVGLHQQEVGCGDVFELPQGRLESMTWLAGCGHVDLPCGSKVCMGVIGRPKVPEGLGGTKHTNLGHQPGSPCPMGLVCNS